MFKLENDKPVSVPEDKRAALSSELNVRGRFAQNSTTASLYKLKAFKKRSGKRPRALKKGQRSMSWKSRSSIQAMLKATFMTEPSKTLSSPARTGKESTMTTACTAGNWSHTTGRIFGTRSLTGSLIICKKLNPALLLGLSYFLWYFALLIFLMLIFLAKKYLIYIKKSVYTDWRKAYNNLQELSAFMQKNKR